MMLREAEPDPFQPRQALPVPARVVTFERRAAEPLRAGYLERGAERERTPDDRAAVALRERVDLERGEIGVARGEVEPEFDRRSVRLSLLIHLRHRVCRASHGDASLQGLLTERSEYSKRSNQRAEPCRTRPP